MRLIADSGSSVCDWVLTFEGHRVMECRTIGFNPFFHNEVIIRYALERTELLSKYASRIREVYFYGAGCSSDERKEVLKRALKFVFGRAKIYVQHDLEGATYAILDKKPCIVSLLGTGSNSCFFDGERILEKTYALGHILGDEGSGSYFGKELMKLFLYNKLPKHIHQLIKERHGLTKEIIFDNVYNMPNANVYLASFMKTLSSIREDEFVQEFIYKGISKFIIHHVWIYKEHRTIPTHFIGSIPYHFKELIETACYKHRLHLGEIIERPISNLVKYHNQDFL